MRLRKLQINDAPLMLEWMHDESVVENMHVKFAEKTLVDCEQFICVSWNDKENLHLAIADDNDTYMGTVSLKHITEISAEFAISVRSCAMGKGFSKYAMNEMIYVGLEEKGLKQIYWYVSTDNKRAVKFYDKNGYQQISPDYLLDKGVFYIPDTLLYMVSTNTKE